MSDSVLNAAALRETARTLSATAGIGESAAAELLDKRIRITTETLNPAAVTMADEVELLLARTFVSVTREPEPPVDLEMVIGATQPVGRVRNLFVTWSRGAITIGQALADNESAFDQHPMFLALGACYAAAAATKALTGHTILQPLPDPLIIRFDELGIEEKWLTEPIVLSDTFMAGAGAIGNGLLRALRHTNVCGVLNIADDDIVDDTNLQRQVFFSESDIGQPKAAALANNAQRYFPELKLIPHDCRLQALRSDDNDHWLRRLVVCVDSRRARRQLQEEIAGEVFDASTTDIREAIVHYHKQPTSAACLSCIYYADQQELQREDILATGLGLTVAQVRQPAIDHQAAESVVQHLGLDIRPEQLVGLACDTLFKQLCGQGLLKAAPDKQILAPFAFVSVLAGTLLAIELVRRLAGSPFDDNYWRVSAWSPPIASLRTRRKRRKDCSFCGKSNLLAARNVLWTSNTPHCVANT